MLRIDQIRLLPGDSETLLPVKCARILRLSAEDIVSCAVLRRAIDAREGLTLVYTAAVEVKREDTVLRRCRDKRVSRYAPETYALPAAVTAPEIPPIVVGAGPAGLFAALVLARCGARPIVLERGRPVEQRQADVERFWSGGALDTDVRVECLHVNCRLLSPRKVLLRCLLSFSMAATELRGAEVLSPEAKESDTFFQTTLIESERWIDPVEAVYSFSERIECPKPIGTILSKTLTLSPPEVFEREGVVVVNSNAHYTALVEEENTDNTVFAVMRTIPISMEFNEPEGEHFHAELRVATLDASAELNDYGENKIMAVSFSVDARLKGYANEPLELVTDAFNSNYENHIRTDSLYYDIPVFAAERSFTVEKTVETDANLLEVLDTIATVSVASTVKEEGGLRVRGNIAYSVLAIADYGVTTIDSVEPFDELFPANTPEGDVDYYSFGYPLSASSALVGSGTVGTKVVVMLSIFGFEKREVTVAAELTMEESAKDEFADEAVIYYYPDRDETLWNVAKQYSVNPALLRSDNESAFDESDHVRARMLRICKK